MRSEEEKERKAAKPRVKYVKKQFKTERAMRGKRFTYEAPAVSAKPKGKPVDKPKVSKPKTKTTPKIDISVDTKQVEHDKSVADELKKREKLAKPKTEEKKADTPKLSKDEPEF